jgi:transcriptional regulator with XRE-family HTH domain
MKFSAEFLAKAVAGSPREAALLAPVMRKCAGAGAAKSNAFEHVDDVEQELWLFLMKNASRLDEAYNVEPYLIETARKMSLAYNRKYSFFGTEGSEDLRGDGISDLAGNEVSSQDEAIDALTEQTEQQRAMDYLLSKSPALRAVIGQDVEPEEDAEMRKKALPLKAARTLSPEQRELRKMRLDLGLSQIDMASRVGCKLPTYQAYEYGKTSSVKAAVMDAARKLKIDPKFSYVDQVYGKKSMRVIANDWAARLGLNADSPTELAAVLGVDKSTCSRWFDKKLTVVPDMEKMVTYERRVNDEEKWLKSRKKARKVH